MRFKGVLCLMAALLVVVLTGCNTVKGIAKDVDASAEAGERVIKDATTD